MQTIGFIGLGTMGLPMAKNILKAGYSLRVYNRTPGKADELKALGAQVAASPAEAARGSEAVFTMLTADQAVREVILGPDGVKEGASPGLIVIDSSTISPATSQFIAAELSKVQAEMLDAPVSGSEPQAIEGMLTFMVGGKQSVYEKCLPLFEIIGKASFYMGENGKGAYTKLGNNLMVAINMVSVAEALVFVTKAGLDPELFLEVAGGGGGRSGMAEQKGPKILNRDFYPHFAAALMYKDVGLVGEVAREFNLPLPASAIVKEILNMTIAQGHGHEDLCAVVKCYEEWARTKVHKLPQED